MTKTSRALPPALLAALLLLLPLPARAQDRPGETPERLYGTLLACASCHGQTGEGAYGPRLHRTPLPLHAFLRQVRAPRAEMPTFTPRDASDASLVAVYAWLGGRDGVAAPLPLDLQLPGLVRAPAGEPIETALTVAALDAGSGGKAAASARYRLSLDRRNGTPVAGHAVEYRPAGRKGWERTATDAHGGAFLGAAGGLPLSAEGEAPTHLRIAGLPGGRYALIVEALAPDGETPLGIASVPLVVW